MGRGTAAGKEMGEGKASVEVGWGKAGKAAEEKTYIGRLRRCRLMK